jgi:hypothetical protein
MFSTPQKPLKSQFFLCRYRPYKSFFLQVLACSSTLCLLAISGLLLRSHVLISAARSPNFMSSDPGLENDGPSNELSVIIGLLIFLLAAPAFVAIILLPSAQSAFRDIFAELRNTELFRSVFENTPFKTQSKTPEAQSSSEALNTAAASKGSENISFEIQTHEPMASNIDFDQIDMNQIDFSKGSQIAAKRTAIYTNY